MYNFDRVLLAKTVTTVLSLLLDCWGPPQLFVMIAHRATLTGLEIHRGRQKEGSIFCSIFCTAGTTATKTGSSSLLLDIHHCLTRVPQHVQEMTRTFP